MGRVWLLNTHTQTEHLVALFTISLHKMKALICFDSSDLGVKEKKSVTSSLPPVLLLHFHVPMSGPLLCTTSQFSLSLSVVCARAGQRAPPTTQIVPFNLFCATRTHTSYLGRRSSSQCHFQFGWDWGLLGRPNGLADGREMLADVTNNVPVSDPLSSSGGILHLSCMAVLPFTAVCARKVPFCAKLHNASRAKGAEKRLQQRRFDFLTPGFTHYNSLTFSKILTWLCALKFCPHFEHATLS